MADREKVIKGLETCYYPPSKCEDCPYHDLPDEQSCNDMLCLDALALLKEQEAVVRCKDCKHGRMINILNYTCTESQNHCEHILHSPDWFCADGRKKND